MVTAIFKKIKSRIEKKLRSVTLTPREVASLGVSMVGLGIICIFSLILLIVDW